MRAEHAPPLGGAPDRIEWQSESESGVDLLAYKLIRADDPYLAGHFPDFTIYPGVFLIESVGQVADEFARSLELWLELAAVDSVRFSAPVIPGDTLAISCRCSVTADSAVAVRAECRNDNAVRVAQLRLTYRIGGSNRA
ncbi:hypothetical protein [Nocardia noduli]|uniref:hypothetical protein n=1 Tax=Nocardia noduli TaxID=2815722 RepID=UPI001C22B15C|nr:hypothetical protein [Nocardia noduli]